MFGAIAGAIGAIGGSLAKAGVIRGDVGRALGYEAPTPAPRVSPTYMEGSTRETAIALPAVTARAEKEMNYLPWLVVAGLGILVLNK